MSEEKENRIQTVKIRIWPEAVRNVLKAVLLVALFVVVMLLFSRAAYAGKIYASGFNVPAHAITIEAKSQAVN